MGSEDDRLGSDELDSDEPLTRDDSWFARNLGEQWEAVERGIYHFVGSEAGSTSLDDVVAHDGQRHDGENGAANGRPARRWTPWRRP